MTERPFPPPWMTDHGLHVEVQGGEIIVTLPGSNYKVVYYKSAEPGADRKGSMWEHQSYRDNDTSGVPRPRLEAR